MNINLTFRNKEQESFFWSQHRNNLFDGGFGNGKTYVAMQRAFIHLTTFANYRMAICRQKYKVLKATTMSTFFKICPPSLIYKHNETDGYTILTNKSLIYWMHLDAYDEQDLRGLEINSACIDQGEETIENLYLVLDARIGRWDKAIVPDHLLLTKTPEKYHEEIKKAKDKRILIEKYTQWPRNKWGTFLVNNYMDVLCNPSEEDEFHWTYRRYNPASLEKQPSHFYIHRQTDDALNDARTIEQIKNRDSEWVNKYYYGLTGTPKARIHELNKMSIIDPTVYPKEDFDKFIKLLKSRAALYRILDHAETGVSTCSWAAAINNVHVFYREYYVERTLISANRQNISDLTEDEEIQGDFADPQIFKKTKQNEGGFWAVADEYAESEIIAEAPPIFWTPADNNELATRNRINELLQLSPKFFHPITKESPAPGLYFILKCSIFPWGCEKSINQLKAQRRRLLGSDNGKNIYSDERDENIVDHAYDCVRYYVAMHNTSKPEEVRKPPRKSFAYFNQILKRQREQFSYR